MTDGNRVRAATLLGIVLCVCTMRPAAAHAQRSGNATLAAELDSSTSAAVLREIERASGRGLPTEPLLAKTREGRLKRASGARIRSAVVALAIRLDSARAALGPLSITEELVAGAEAIAAGASPDALRALRHASPSPISVPLGALAQLLASGVPAHHAVAMVIEVLRRRLTPGEVIAFGNAVEMDVAGGLPPEEAAQFRLRSAGTPSASSAAVDAAPGVLSAQVNSHPSPSPRRRP